MSFRDMWVRDKETRQEHIWRTQKDEKPTVEPESGLTPFGQMMAGMVQVQRGLELATDDHEELGQIEATLVVNYVQRATDGIQVKYPNNVSKCKVHWLMMAVLKAYNKKFSESQLT